MWMPTDLATSGAGTIVGIVLGCAIALALEMVSVSVNPKYGAGIRLIQIPWLMLFLGL